MIHEMRVLNYLAMGKILVKRLLEKTQEQHVPAGVMHTLREQKLMESVPTQKGLATAITPEGKAFFHRLVEATCKLDELYQEAIKAKELAEVERLEVMDQLKSALALTDKFREALVQIKAVDNLDGGRTLAVTVLEYEELKKNPVVEHIPGPTPPPTEGSRFPNQDRLDSEDVWGGEGNRPMPQDAGNRTG